MRHFSVISVLALTISNILLTLRLLHKAECPLPDVVGDSVLDCTGGAALKIPQLPSTLPQCVDYAGPHVIGAPGDNQSKQLIFGHLHLDAGRWDNSRQFKYYDFAVVGDQFDALSKVSVVTLATQSSIERLHSLVHVSQNWQGPISVALYAAGDDELYLMQLYITYLRNCYVSIREQVTFHLAIPRARPPTQLRHSLNADGGNFICDEPEATLKRLLKFRTAETAKWRIRNAYPQNHLRNLARKGGQTLHVFLTDIDIIPCINFTQHLNAFLRTAKCTKLCAYVIPTYEIDSRAKFPKDKLDLIRLSRKGLARPFHHKVFIYNQYATNFTRWEADGGLVGQTETVVSYNVTNFEFLYEPFYVATDEVPPHDERFLGYGFTRNTQVGAMEGTSIIMPYCCFVWFAFALTDACFYLLWSGLRNVRGWLSISGAVADIHLPLGFAEQKRTAVMA